MGRFMNWLAENFNKVRKTMSSAIIKKGYAFDEDVFSDTVINCDRKLEGREMNDDELLKYLWISFKNNTLRDLQYFRHNGTNEFPEDLLEEDTDNTLFNEISDIIRDEFGGEVYKYFLLHANGITYEELEQITERKDLKYQFRKVRDFVRNKMKGELD